MVIKRILLVITLTLPLTLVLSANSQQSVVTKKTNKTNSILRPALLGGASWALYNYLHSQKNIPSSIAQTVFARIVKLIGISQGIYALTPMVFELLRKLPLKENPNIKMAIMGTYFRSLLAATTLSSLAFTGIELKNSDSISSTLGTFAKSSFIDLALAATMSWFAGEKKSLDMLPMMNQA